VVIINIKIKTGAWIRIRQLLTHPAQFRYHSFKLLAWKRYIYIYNTLVGKPEGKRPLGRSRRRREDIRIDLREIGVVVWTAFTQLRIGNKWLALVNTTINLQIP
jgi:hypothetical protein